MKSVQFTFKELQERNDSLNIQSVLIQIRYCNWGGRHGITVCGKGL